MAVPVTEKEQTFESGLTTIFNPVRSPPGFMVAENVWVSPDDFGAAESVPGFVRVNDSAATQQLRKVYFAKASDGTRIAIVVGQSRVYSIDLTPGFGHALTEIKSGLSNAKEISIAALNDTLYFFNGVDTPWKATIAPTPVVSNIGLARPDVSGATANRVTALQAFHLIGDEDDHLIDASGNHVIGKKIAEGEVKGVVKYAVATMSGTTESALSAAFGEVDAMNGSKVRVRDIPLGSTGVAKVYRTYANRDNFWYHHTEEGAANGTATFIDNIADEAISDPMNRHGDLPPATIESVVSHFNRVFGLAGNLLYFSDLNDAESWWTASNGYVINVMGDDGDTGVALARDSEGILIFKRNHLYRLLGRIPEDFYMTEVTLSDPSNRSIGLSGIQAMTYFPGGLAFYWNRGIYIYSGGQAAYISLAIEDLLDSEILDARDDLVSMGYHPVQRTIWVSLPLRRVPFNSHTLFYSLSSQRWTGMMNQGFRGYSVIEDGHGDLFLWAAGSRGFRG